MKNPLSSIHRRDFLRRGGVGIAAASAGLRSASSQEKEPPPARADSPARERLEPFTAPPDFFPILPWDHYHGRMQPYQKRELGLESLADCGFTMAGFVYPEDLPLCEKLGLAAIINPLEPEQPIFRQWNTLSDEEIDRRIRTMVEKAGNSKAILGYFLTDEPGASAFPALGKAVAAVKKHAPGKLAYINLFPSYATIGAPNQSQLETPSYNDYLERFATQVKPQFISYDNYSVQASDDMRSPRAAKYYADLLTIRAVAIQYGLPFWNVVSANQIRPGLPIPSPANLAFQAYTTLAAGGRGISWFQYYARAFEQGRYAYSAVAHDGKKTETWHYLQLVNKHIGTLGPIMNRLRSTGVFFSEPPPVPGLPLLPGRMIRQVRSTASPRLKLNPPVMVGEFAGEDGEDYAMVVNLSLETSTNIRLETKKPQSTKQFVSAADGRLLPLDEKEGHWLVAGQGVLIKLR